MVWFEEEIHSEKTETEEQEEKKIRKVDIVRWLLKNEFDVRDIDMEDMENSRIIAPWTMLKYFGKAYETDRRGKHFTNKSSILLKSTNEYLNKNYDVLEKHKGLFFLIMWAVSREVVPWKGKITFEYTPKEVNYNRSPETLKERIIYAIHPELTRMERKILENHLDDFDELSVIAESLGLDVKTRKSWRKRKKKK